MTQSTNYTVLRVIVVEWDKKTRDYNFKWSYSMAGKPALAKDTLYTIQPTHPQFCRRRYLDHRGNMDTVLAADGQCDRPDGIRPHKYHPPPLCGAIAVERRDLGVQSRRQIAEALRNGKIDAFFVVAGYPTGAIVELASAANIKLVPISGAGADALVEKFGFSASSDIPEGTYEGVAATPIVAVGAQWFTNASEDEELIYNIIKALWNEQSRKLLDVSHAKGKTITIDTALNGIGVPLHAGAERFYKEAGLLK